MTIRLTKEELLELIIKFKNNELTKEEKALIENTPLENITLLGLQGFYFYDYLNMYTSLYPHKFTESMVKSFRNKMGPINMDRLKKFLTIYPKHIEHTSQIVLFDEKNRTDFLSFLNNNIDLFERNMMPSFLKNDPAVLGYFNTKEEKEKKGMVFSDYDENWLHKDNGELIKLFTIKGSFPYTTKSDYIRLARGYYDSRMTMSDFCKTYGISNQNHFSLMLDQIEKENRQRKVQEEIVAGNNIIAELKTIGKMIIDGEISFEEYIKKYYKASHTVYLFREALGNEADIFDDIFSEQMYDYITREDCNVDAARLSTLFGIDFCFINAEEAASKTETQLVKKIKDYLKDKDGDTISRIIKGSSQQHIANDYGSAILINGEMYEITEQDKGDTIMYMASNDISVSERSYDYYLRQIILGNIEVEHKPSPFKK